VLSRWGGRHVQLSCNNLAALAVVWELIEFVGGEGSSLDRHCGCFLLKPIGRDRTIMGRPAYGVKAACRLTHGISNST